MQGQALRVLSDSTLSNHDPKPCIRIFVPVDGWPLINWRARGRYKSPGQGHSEMNKPANNSAVKTETNKESKPALVVVPAEKTNVTPEATRELTLEERIQRVENLQLLVSKRARIVSTRSELDRFQIASNDFNCALDISDSDGNKFRTTFTPGVKKVLEFLKKSFDESIKEVEEQIQF